jgi:hypothetical protein
MLSWTLVASISTARRCVESEPVQAKTTAVVRQRLVWRFLTGTAVRIEQWPATSPLYPRTVTNGPTAIRSSGKPQSRCAAVPAFSMARRLTARSARDLAASDLIFVPALIGILRKSFALLARNDIYRIVRALVPDQDAQFIYQHAPIRKTSRQLASRLGATSPTSMEKAPALLPRPRT